MVETSEERWNNGKRLVARTTKTIVGREMPTGDEAEGPHSYWVRQFCEAAFALLVAEPDVEMIEVHFKGKDRQTERYYVREDITTQQ